MVVGFAIPVQIVWPTRRRVISESEGDPSFGSRIRSSLAALNLVDIKRES